MEAVNRGPIVVSLVYDLVGMMSQYLEAESYLVSRLCLKNAARFLSIRDFSSSDL